jgi:undecaprenyl-diphosphatase
VALGVVQGLTEFLPVSSSGHLTLGRHLLGIGESSVLFDLTVHAATLTATLVYYRRTVAGMAHQSLLALRGALDPVDPRPLAERYPDAWLLVLISVGTVPTATLGLVFRRPLEMAFGEPRVVLVAMLATAFLLLLSRWAGDGTRRLTMLSALVIGVVQGVAILPGISRSGATIAVALLLGIDRETSARFSFLLAVPAILGALLLEVAGTGLTGVNDAVPVLAAGFAAAAATGVVALALLVPLVRRGRLSYFAAYLVPAAVIGWVLL